MTTNEQDRITYNHILRVLENTDDTDRMCIEAINCLKSLRPELTANIDVPKKIKFIENIYAEPYTHEYRSQQLAIIHVVTDLYAVLEVEQDDSFTFPQD